MNLVANSPWLSAHARIFGSTGFKTAAARRSRACNCFFVNAEEELRRAFPDVAPAEMEATVHALMHRFPSKPIVARWRLERCESPSGWAAPAEAFGTAKPISLSVVGFALVLFIGMLVWSIFRYLI
jgi:hypothetical protein